MMGEIGWGTRVQSWGGFARGGPKDGLFRLRFGCKGGLGPIQVRPRGEVRLLGRLKMRARSAGALVALAIAARTLVAAAAIGPAAAFKAEPS